MRTSTGAELVAAPARRQTLRVNFRALPGESPTLMLASCLRFCADGTLRGADHCVVAAAAAGGWTLGGKTCRDFECDGPVRLRLTIPGRELPLDMGPYASVRSSAGMLFTDQQCLDIVLPGRQPWRAGDCTQLTLTWTGADDGKA